MSAGTKSLLCALALACLCHSPALADISIYKVTTTNPAGPPSRGTVYVYDLGRTSGYRLSGQAVSSKSVNLAHAAKDHKDFPLAVSAGGFTADSRPAGLIALKGSYVSPPSSANAMPTLLCFTARGLQIQQARGESDFAKAASRCLAAIQSPRLFIENGRRLPPETKPLTWRHVFVAQSVAGRDSVVIVEGSLSAASLGEFLTGSRPCPTLGDTTQAVRIRVFAGGRVSAECGLGLRTVA